MSSIAAADDKSATASSVGTQSTLGHGSNEQGEKQQQQKQQGQQANARKHWRASKDKKVSSSSSSVAGRGLRDNAGLVSQTVDRRKLSREQESDEVELLLAPESSQIESVENKSAHTKTRLGQKRQEQQQQQVDIRGVTTTRMVELEANNAAEKAESIRRQDQHGQDQDQKSPLLANHNFQINLAPPAATHTQEGPPNDKGVNEHMASASARGAIAAEAADATVKRKMEAEFERKWSQCSATDSQASTSFGCSLASSALNSSRRSSSICTGLEQPPVQHNNKSHRHNNNSNMTTGPNGTRKFLLDKLARKSSSIVDCFNLDQRAQATRRHQPEQRQQGPPSSAGDGSSLDNSSNDHRATHRHSSTTANMDRTISQSMLELDGSCIPSKTRFEVSWRDLEFAYEPRSWPARANAWLSSSLGALCGRCQSRRPNLVLKGISGGFKSNQLVAIIGPSGCGKTTLLQFLAGNNRAQCDQLRIRGLKEPKVAYIGQDDALLPGLTARETLMYASRLQNTRAGFDHAQHIRPILNELGLLECAERNVSKLSGGQAKRVTIAQELLYPTNLLILDEVTSGLDASTSYSIVKLLKYLVSDQRYPMSIVMSIHQPSARLFAIFDQVYVMSAGCCLYEGGCEPAQINTYLAKFGLACPQYHNIADYLIELACCTPAEDGDSDNSGKGSNDDDDDKSHGDTGSGSPSSEKLGAGNDWLLLTSSATTTEGTGQNQQQENINSLSKQRDGQHAIRAQMIAHQRKLKESHYRDESYGITTTKPIATTTTESRKNQNGHNGLLNGRRGELVDKDYGGSDHYNSMCSSSLYLAIEQARNRRPRPFWNHFQIHLSRSLLRIRRSYILTYLQLLTYILLGLQLATFYGPEIGRLSGCPRLPATLMSYVLASNSDANNQRAGGGDDDELGLEVRRIQENMNFLLVAVMTATFAALEITVITFPLEAKTVKREWRNGWYRVSSYFMGRTLADLPFQLVFVMIFCLLVYVLTGQIGLTSWRFVSFVATIVMTALVAQSFGFIFGAMFMDNLPAAVFTAPISIFPTLLFSGFFSRVSQIPAFYRPLTYLSHFRYVFDALLVSLYGYDRCNCDQTTLDRYHASMRNETSSMREMFTYLFGASDCAPPPLPVTTTISPDTSSQPSEEVLAARLAAAEAASSNSVSHDDLSAIQSSNSTLAAQVLETIQHNANQTATMAAHASGGVASFMKPIEDALLEGVFEQIAQRQNSTTTSPLNDTLEGAPDSGEGDMSVMDRLAARFSTRLTTLLNKQSNFGHPMPTECRQFNSYLLTEFNLHDEDLLVGLVMLFLVVIFTRLLCNCLLNITIATRVN